MSVNAQICGLAGGAGLILSAFAPVVSLPIVGAMSPFALHWAAGTVLLLIGLAAGVAGLVNRTRVVSVTGMLGMFSAIGGLIYYFIRRAELSAKVAEETDLSDDNPFAALAQSLGEAMLQSVSLSWGIAVVIMASLVLLAPLMLMKPDKALARHAKAMEKE